MFGSVLTAGDSTRRPQPGWEGGLASPLLPGSEGDTLRARVPPGRVGGPEDVKIMACLGVGILPSMGTRLMTELGLLAPPPSASNSAGGPQPPSRVCVCVCVCGGGVLVLPASSQQSWSVPLSWGEGKQKQGHTWAAGGGGWRPCGPGQAAVGLSSGGRGWRRLGSSSVGPFPEAWLVLPPKDIILRAGACCGQDRARHEEPGPDLCGNPGEGDTFFDHQPCL